MNLLAFAHIPKSGGTTLAELLRGYYGARLVGVQHRNSQATYTATDLRRDLKVNPFARCLAGHSLKPYIDFEENDERLIWFTVCREPVARFISHYQHQFDRAQAKYRLPFLEWMRTYKRHNWMVRMIAGRDDVEAAKQILTDRFRFVGLLEEYNASLLMLREQLGLEGFDVRYAQVANQAPRINVREQVHADFDTYRDDILEQNSLDLELYSYVKDTIWPIQVSDYGCERLVCDLELEFERPSRIMPRLRRWEYLAYRNLVYKPYLWIERQAS